MAKLAGDPGLRERLAANARSLAESKFSAEAIGRQTVALYGSLIPV
jgi:glycosyltransferase involved in cell wall biosynthesis